MLGITTTHLAIILLYQHPELLTYGVNLFSYVWSLLSYIQQNCLKNYVQNNIENVEISGKISPLLHGVDNTTGGGETSN